MSPRPNPEKGLDKEIGRLGFSAITLNGVIGAGIFALPAVAAAHTGLFSPWVFVLCGVLILTIVLSFARAAGFFTTTGGPIAYTTHAFGGFVGFQAGWLFSLARVASIAANTNLMVTYAAWFWQPLNDGAGRAVAVSAVLIALTVANVVGVRRSLITILVLTALKLVPLGLLVLVGLASIDPGMPLRAGIPTPSSLGEIILIVLYAYVGFENASVPAGEGRNARRDLPRALVGTVAVITVFYVLVQWVSLSVVPNLADSTTPLADVAELLLGPFGAALLALGAVFSIGGNLSAGMLTAPRLPYALARDGSLPAGLARIHATYRTPANAVVASGAISLALALSGTFLWLAVMSTMARLVCYALSIAAIPRLEKTIPEQEGQFRLPGGFAIPVAALAVCAWLTAHASVRSWLTMLVFAAAGSVLFLYQRWKNGPSSSIER